MHFDLTLFLQNVHVALVNRQYDYAQFLLDYAIRHTEDHACLSSPSSVDVGLGLHPGQKRDANEDCLLACSDFLPDGQYVGLFVVSDGMGGHVNGVDAARMAIQTILEHITSSVHGDGNTQRPWEQVLAEGVRLANRTIYQRNQLAEYPLAGSQRAVSYLSRMGATVTAMLIVGAYAYVANVGDSRTYLYTPSVGLTKVTRDHSVVAQLLADGLIEDEEDIYTHPERNKITRSVGIHASVDVDTFVFPLQPEMILLLCSDGLWEMTRQRQIEAILASSCVNAWSLAQHLVYLANSNGGADNIGCIVVQGQRCVDSSAMPTRVLDPGHTLSGLVSPSSSPLS